LKPTNDTIAALATPPGVGGVAVVRVSGPQVEQIAVRLMGGLPAPRHATLRTIINAQGEKVDVALVLYFPAPHSFTGEDVLEIQGHGGVVVSDLVLQAALSCGARLAAPGEFSQRAFLNDRMDLVEAEAIADLIEAGSAQAARSALRSLSGEFSGQIAKLLTALIELRVYVEAAIDFPEEELDFLGDGRISSDLSINRECCTRSNSA
jgi:tRNA modification GTPase